MTQVMKRNSGRLIVVGVAVLALLSGMNPAVAQAQPGPGRGGPCARPEALLSPEDRQLIGDRMMQRVQEKLGLSQDQVNEIRTVLRSQRDQARGEIQKLCEARVELRQFLGRQDADPAALKEVTERVKALQGGLLDRRVDTYLALRSKLTAEQWQQWRELRHKMGHRFRGHGPVS
jgi:Spy/CpxP family protein refolding chaperone